MGSQTKTKPTKVGQGRDRDRGRIETNSPRRHLAVHQVVDVVPVHGVEGAAGDGEAVGGFVVDVCFLRLVPLSAADTFVVQTYHDAWLD